MCWLVSEVVLRGIRLWDVVCNGYWDWAMANTVGVFGLGGSELKVYCLVEL